MCSQMKIYKAAIIGLGASGLGVNKIIYGDEDSEILAFETTNIDKRNNLFGFWLTDWMKPYENLIEKKWNKWEINNSEHKIIHTDNNNPYCVISFKTWKEFCLNSRNNLNLVNKRVVNYKTYKNYYKIITDDNNEYFAKKIYDSRSTKQRDNELIQHFYGLNIETPDGTFNDKKLTLMSFTKENSILHFIYLLPLSHNKAMIESTVFSKKVLPEEWYRDKIYKYLEEKSITNFKELSFEKGIIPMFFSNEKNSSDNNIINIGIKGGACKPSTGYAFSFMIKQINILKNSKKNKVTIHRFIENFMDKIFLNYLKNNNENGISFIKIANNLNGYEFQSFMMGYSTLLTKIKIIKSMPKIPFIKALLQ